MEMRQVRSACSSGCPMPRSVASESAAMSSASLRRSLMSAAFASHSQLLGAAAHQLDDLLDSQAVAAQAADDELLGLEIGVGPDRYVRVLLFELPHKRVEPGLNREIE